MRRIEAWLDQGAGECVLRDSGAARIVADSLLHFDGERYELGCFVVMPNHVHVVVRPLTPDVYPLEKILQSWKRHTSKGIHRLRGTSGSLWQEEYFDRIIRDEEHLWRSIQYIGRNPQTARLRTGEYILWLSKEWESLGWKFEADVAVEGNSATNES